MTEPLPDEALERARSGDHDAFAALIEEHRSVVFGIAWNFFGSRDRAEEIAQEVFLQLFRHLRKIDSRQHLLFWLRQVTTRKCIDAMRRHVPPSIDLEEAGLSIAAHAPDPFLRRRLQRLVAALPPMQRLILTLRYQEDLGPADIGEMVGMPVNTVKSYLHRALLALRRDLGEV